MAPAVLLRHRASAEHDTGAHPERAARLVALERTLEANDWLGWEPRESPAASDADLERVHPAAHLAAIRDLCAAGGGPIDSDTVVSAGSWPAALHGAGGAVEAARLVLAGEADVAFSAHRPPGHHAEATRAMGFCLVNSIAVAARWAQAVAGVQRVMVLDWDVHHGNGTNDVFHADADVLFVSVHESPLYPGTGPATDVGSGAGTGYTVNVPVPAGSGDDVFASVVEHVAVPLARAFDPGLLLVSAGFDAHRDDPLADCAMTAGGFATLAASVRSLGVPLALVLEGGYDLEALVRSTAATMLALGPGAPAPAAPAVAEHPLALAALERLRAGSWPGL